MILINCMVFSQALVTEIPNWLAVTRTPDSSDRKWMATATFRLTPPGYSSQFSKFEAAFSEHCGPTSFKDKSWSIESCTGNDSLMLNYRVWTTIHQDILHIPRASIAHDRQKSHHEGINVILPFLQFTSKHRRPSSGLCPKTLVQK